MNSIALFLLFIVFLSCASYFVAYFVVFVTFVALVHVFDIPGAYHTCANKRGQNTAMAAKEQCHALSCPNAMLTRWAKSISSFKMPIPRWRAY